MVYISGISQANLQPGAEVNFEESLKIENRSNYLVDLIFDSNQRQVRYRTQNELNVNILDVGEDIRKIVIQNAHPGLDLVFFV